MEIHNPNVIGTLSSAGNAGLSGQVLTSQGPAAQPLWSGAIDNSFTFASASSLVHTISHNLNNSFPSITVWETVTNTVVEPATITSITANQLTITFFVARAIAGTIVG